MAWTIEYAESVRKSVEKHDPQTRRRIRDYLEIRIASLDDPRSQGKGLTGLSAASGDIGSEITVSSARSRINGWSFLSS